MAPKLEVRERPITASAVQFTADVVDAYDNLNNPRYPDGKKKEWREFEEHCRAEGDDGTWVSVVNQNESDSRFGKLGVYNVRTEGWQILNLNDWVVRFEMDGRLVVVPDHEFEARWEDRQGPATLRADDVEDDDEDEEEEEQKPSQPAAKTSPATTSAKSPATPAAKTGGK